MKVRKHNPAHLLEMFYKRVVQDSSVDTLLASYYRRPLLRRFYVIIVYNTNSVGP